MDKLTLENIKIGMRVNTKQLSGIKNTTILLINQDTEFDENDIEYIVGDVIFIGDKNDPEYKHIFDKYTIGNNLPTIIYNSDNFEMEGIYSEYIEEN